MRDEGLDPKPMITTWVLIHSDVHMNVKPILFDILDGDTPNIFGRDIAWYPIQNNVHVPPLVLFKRSVHKIFKIFYTYNSPSSSKWYCAYILIYIVPNVNESIRSLMSTGLPKYARRAPVFFARRLRLVTHASSEQTKQNARILVSIHGECKTPCIR